MRESEETMFFLVWTILVAGLAASISVIIATGIWSSAAVDNGHAEYYLDGDNNKRLRWADCERKEQTE